MFYGVCLSRDFNHKQSVGDCLTLSFYLAVHIHLACFLTASITWPSSLTMTDGLPFSPWIC